MIESARGEAETCLVVPCYNEAQRLNTDAFQRFLNARTGVKLLFVDDGSRDGTHEILESICADFTADASMVRCSTNRGKAEAVRVGVLEALDRLNPSYIGYWDADLATPLETVLDFRKVLSHRAELTMVFGARVQLLGRNVRRSAVRHYLGRIFATAVSTMLQLAIYDSQCGAKLFRVGPETREIFSEPFLSRWVFDVELLARYQQLYSREGRSLAEAVYEYPLETWIDVSGSKITAGDFLVAFRDVVRIRRKYPVGIPPSRV